MIKRSGLAFTGIVASILLAGPAPGRAQETDSANRNERSGFFFGLGFGPGTLSIHTPEGSTSKGDADTGFSNMIRIGTALNQKVLVGVAINGWIRSEFHGLGFGTITGAVHYYPSADGAFFLTAGAGFGAEFDGENIGSGPAGLLGLGYDARLAENISVTPFLNGFVASIDDSYFGEANFTFSVAQVGVGLTFH